MKVSSDVTISLLILDSAFKYDQSLEVASTWFEPGLVPCVQ